MGAEKAGSKTGGFFHLFDWNRKSRKKLFANGTISPVGSKQRTNVSGNVPTMRPPKFIEDDDTGVVSSVKGSDYSCASSVTDEEGHGARAPGVVARLMGLDSLPGAGVSENFSTPLFDSRSLQEKCYQKGSLDTHIDENFSNVSGRSECHYRRPVELRCQKMPSSPIERFQTEVLPPRSARSFPINHYKLLSPIKNPRFLSGKDAAHIMEAAAKILEPGPPNMNAKSTVPSLGSSSLTVRVHDSKENIAICQRASRLSESSRRSPELNALKHLRGHSLSESWDSQDGATSLGTSTEPGKDGFTGAKCGAKSVSLAIQAKVNVKKRECSNASSSTSSIPREPEDARQNQPFRSQLSSRNKAQRKASPGPPGVLKQNNQKQNGLPAKEKSTSKSLVSNPQARKATSGDSNSGRSKNFGKNKESSKVVCRKEDLTTANPEKDAPSSRTRKKRSIDGNYQSGRNSFADSTSVGRREKRIQSAITIDEHKKWVEDIKGNDTDVVSFTFTSPMTKPALGPQPTRILEKNDNISTFPVGLQGERDTRNAEDSKLAMLGRNVLSGDALSILLEQKLRELTSGFVSSNLAEVGNMSSPTPLFPGSASAEENSHAVTMFGDPKSTPDSCRTRFHDESNSSLPGAESAGFSNCNAYKEPEREHPSPLSILEASFSNESYTSCDVSDSINGSKILSFSVATGSGGRNPPTEAELDVCDSASSLKVAVKSPVELTIPPAGSSGTSRRREEDYVRSILRNADEEALSSLTHSGAALDPLLFDWLENNQEGSNGDDDEDDPKIGRLRRKALFDCVGEFLDSRRRRHFCGGYHRWARGVAAMSGRVDQLAAEAHEEVSRWKTMGDWMVDELVDKDMGSSPSGRWVDFEAEAFEVGVEVEERILSSIVDDVLADFFIV
ncbi:unnamed protein product [Spirodela intermedia]|uniref:Uncharacterized protein n=1 Tax=Spirodela intermedia TaxID=51605 RepID=A0A7I8JZR8_SPIIN|nr:unnamed protein product [Spirodela intermedia]